MHKTFCWYIVLVLTSTVLSCVQSDKKLAAEARLAGLMEHAGGLMVKGNYDGVRDQHGTTGATLLGCFVQLLSDFSMATSLVVHLTRFVAT